MPFPESASAAVPACLTSQAGARSSRCDAAVRTEDAVQQVLSDCLARRLRCRSALWRLLIRAAVLRWRCLVDWPGQFFKSSFLTLSYLVGFLGSTTCDFFGDGGSRAGCFRHMLFCRFREFSLYAGADVAQVLLIGTDFFCNRLDLCRCDRHIFRWRVRLDQLMCAVDRFFHDGLCNLHVKLTNTLDTVEHFFRQFGHERKLRAQMGFQRRWNFLFGES